MHIKNMFKKPINRDIKGVIKVGQDDELNVYQELDEYIVTNELAEHFEDFFKAYNKGVFGHTDKMGVWISGFFGSGKSHFLKILSYLLANKKIKNKEALSFFEDKIEDTAILENMKDVSKVTTDVVLFNIDAKSESDSNLNRNSILRVFNQAFNEMQGFCGSIPWLADLERQLVKEHVYEDFKSTFESIAGSTWEYSRENLYYEEEGIVKALAKTTKMSEEAVRNWFHKAEDNYSLSIEKFAQRVNEYIERQADNHHVLFLVDEMGQYIGDDTQLMLNLQTVVEQLGIYCGGKCWVLVTSQQEIESITKVKGDDFSKIQGRFNTRLRLSSSNVDEVIRKRILKKNDTAKQDLQLLYPKKRSIINNLITFKDIPEFKSFADQNDFIDVYPFIPYQFHLLQKVFTGVRVHGAAGKSLSEGERSLLSAFQASAIAHASDEVGTLVPFSAFYETIETFLEISIRSVIIQAQQNSRLTDEDVEILKLLFLVKYVKEMPSNIENIATLLVKHIDEDKVEKMKTIQNSLQRLICETLVQKNGEEYIFLTSDEQAVNREIKSIHIDFAETIRDIGLFIFEDIYNKKKFRYSTRYHFSFNTYIDSLAIHQQGHPFGVKVITPYFEGINALHEAELKSMSQRENNLIIKLPQDTTLIEEMEQAKKIDSYLRKAGGTIFTSTVDDIRLRKRTESTDRKKRVKTLLIEGLKEADLYVNNQALKVKSKKTEARMNEAIKVLIESLYHKLNQIRQHTNSVKDLYPLLIRTNEQLCLIEEPNKLALAELNAYISRNSQRNIPITMKSVLTFFSNIPYGWHKYDIVASVIKLFKSQKINLLLNKQHIELEDKEFLNYLTKRDYIEHTFIKEREKTPAKYINNIKNLSKELTGVASPFANEEQLRSYFNLLVEKELETVIKRYLDRCDKKLYPGKDLLLEAEMTFNELLAIPDTLTWYKVAYQLKEDILDYVDDRKDIKHFFEEQQSIFDDALEKIETFEKNRSYVMDEEIIKAIRDMKKIVQQANPYANIYQLPVLIKRFVDKFTGLLEIECRPVREVIKTDYEKVMKELSVKSFKDELLPVIKERFDDLSNRLETVNNFYEAIAMKEESGRLKVRSFNEIHAKQMELSQSQKVRITPIVPSGTTVKPVELKTEYQRKTTLNVCMSSLLRESTTIENEQEIDNLLEQMRERLKKKLKEDTVIRLI
ncbi:BREX system P-loop protein BrxC [Alkalihalobacterium chitinilyticum]|uniref:BREX system P-loop protein BrxC n=1 Tax=Alkalihalobacterium chitinilyticum TaxID=2980103 RepID=A0ABT5VDI3_9BACI|nr:BREX system P-loop protein BrxC [Alkalihalobacterium chitinilyticum]MDE5413511.1 BREX system P-loop protein BrxC [Alkalihalobacterium chitinilyticum]